MTPERFVMTAEIRRAVSGREEEILAALGIDVNRSRTQHVNCPYPDHGGEKDWRWDRLKKKAFCTCLGRHADSIFNVVEKVRGLSGFDDAKIECAEILGRSDLIKTKGSGKGQKTDPYSLLNPPSSQEDKSLPRAYLAHRLGVEPADVIMPVTKSIGWKALDYFDPPAKGSQSPIHVGSFPCAVFETVATDGRTHAHRIYLAAGGAGKADLGKNAAGYDRDPKKSAKAQEGAPSTAGCSVLWGAAQTAPHIIIAEGIETAAAVALAFAIEIEAGKIAVASAINAGGVEAFEPYPATKRITVAADRDEKATISKPAPSRRGELAARTFGLKHHGRHEVDIALPGRPGESIDWLDVLFARGVESVRAGVSEAVPFVPTQAELDQEAGQRSATAELERVAADYPLPKMHGLRIEYGLSEDEVWIHKTITVGKGENRQEVDVPVCTPFTVPAWLAYLDHDHAHGLRVVVQDMTRQARAFDIERADLAAVGALEARKQLLAFGMRAANGGEATAADILRATLPKTGIKVVKRPGWHWLDDLLAPIFVCPSGQILGLPEAHSIELSINSRVPPALAVGGTFEGWREAAAASASQPDCRHFTLGLLAGFAGVLVSLTGADSCGLNMSGLSSSGKSTAQRNAASVWSKPVSGKDTLFQSAKATVNSIEQMAYRSNGTVFVLDELAHVSGKEVAKIIYTIAGNVGKTRMTAAATIRNSYGWATFAVLSAETSLEEKIRNDGGDWTTGQAVRIVDIDVTGVKRDLAPELMSQIEAVKDHFGHAGPMFVARLIENGYHLNTDEVRLQIKAFAQKLVAQGFPNQAQVDAAILRSAYPFAYLGVAGLMARNFEILPAETDVRGAITWAWNRFLGSSGATALEPAVMAIANLQLWIAERWNTEIQPTESDHSFVRNAVGWYDEHAVYLPDKRLVEAAGGSLKENEVAKALDEGGWIVKRKDKDCRFVAYVPKIGKVKAYALDRRHFGRGVKDDVEPVFRSYSGGRR